MFIQLTSAFRKQRAYFTGALLISIAVIFLTGCQFEPQDYREQLLTEIAIEHGNHISDRLRPMSFLTTRDQDADLLLLQSVLITGEPPRQNITDQQTWRAIVANEFPDWKSPMDENRWQLEIRTLGQAGTTVGVLYQTILPAQPPWDTISRALDYAQSITGQPLPARYGNAILIVYGAPVTAQAQASNRSSHIAIRNAYRNQPEASAWILAHEISHFWWRNNAPYIDEGMSELIAYLANQGRQRPAATATPCDEEFLNIWIDRVSTMCDYDLGGDMFFSLMQHDAGSFRKSAGHLYRVTPDAGPHQLVRTFRSPQQRAIIKRYLPQW